jgi:hypothetical protein
LRFQVVLMLISAASIAVPAYAYGNQAVRIVAPKPGVTVHSNSGNLAVTVAVSPPLTKFGGHLSLLLDGKTVARGTGQHFVLKGIERGGHTLRLEVNAADGTVLATSPQLTFQMWRASRFFQTQHEPG